MAPLDSGDILQGTLDLLILKTLSLEPMHGWAISQRLEQLSDDALRVGAGSLYPALQRLDERGWETSDWGVTQENRRAKYYELTPAGQRALGEVGLISAIGTALRGLRIQPMEALRQE